MTAVLHILLYFPHPFLWISDLFIGSQGIGIIVNICLCIHILIKLFLLIQNRNWFLLLLAIITIYIQWRACDFQLIMLITHYGQKIVLLLQEIFYFQVLKIHIWIIQWTSQDLAWFIKLCLALGWCHNAWSHSCCCFGCWISCIELWCWNLDVGDAVVVSVDYFRSVAMLLLGGSKLEISLSDISLTHECTSSLMLSHGHSKIILEGIVAFDWILVVLSRPCLIQSPRASIADGLQCSCGILRGIWFAYRIIKVQRIWHCAYLLPKHVILRISRAHCLRLRLLCLGGSFQILLV